MDKFKDTKEQNRIFKQIQTSKKNLLVQARAGSGKTSTIVKAVKYLPEDASITFLAFNKHIQEELRTKLPDHVRCSTCHGLGMGALKRKYKDSMEFDEFKLHRIVQQASKRWKLDFTNTHLVEDYLKDIRMLANLCRLTLTLKKKYIPNLAEKYGIKTTSQQDLKRIMDVMDKAYNDRKTFDFTDMIYLPAIDNKLWLFPQDYVIVDECQDLNNAQFEIVKKMLKKDKKGNIIGKFIGIGDEKQSIYGFSGSGLNMFDKFKKLPFTEILPLTVSFRCAKEVIREAQKIVPDIKAMPNAPEGVVRDGNVLEEAKDGDFILCRTTLPLLELFFEFLMEDKKAMIKGSDLGKSLVHMTDGFDNIKDMISSYKSELYQYRLKLKARGLTDPSEDSGYAALEDKVLVLEFLGKLTKSIEDLKDKILTIFRDDLQGIILSTVHKAKGLEADRVFIIRPDLLPMTNVRMGWEHIQEKNLEYVAVTRAKRELVYDMDYNIPKEKENE